MLWLAAPGPTPTDDVTNMYAVLEGHWSAPLHVSLPDEVRSEEDTHGMTARTGTESSRKRR
jgi:hypothetical protein